MKRLLFSLLMFAPFLTAQESQLFGHNALNQGNGTDNAIACTSDSTYQLSKSRGARRHTANMHHRRNEITAKKSLVLKQRRANRAAHAQVKADQLRDTKQQEFQSCEYASLKNEIVPDAHYEIRINKYISDQPGYPYFFKLLSQLERGMLSPAGPLSDDENLEDWETIVQEWSKDRQKEHGEDYLVRSARKHLQECPAEAQSTLNRLWFMLGTLNRDEDVDDLHASTFMSALSYSDGDNANDNDNGQLYHPLADSSDSKLTQENGTDNAIACTSDLAYQLSKSRGARRHTANIHHKRKAITAKKSLVLKQRRANRAAHAQIKAGQLRDTKQQELQSREYASLRGMLSPAGPLSDDENLEDWETIVQEWNLITSLQCKAFLWQYLESARKHLQECPTEAQSRFNRLLGTFNSDDEDVDGLHASTPMPTLYYSDTEAQSRFNRLWFFNSDNEDVDGLHASTSMPTLYYSDNDNSSDMSLTNQSSDSNGQASAVRAIVYHSDDDDNDYDDKIANAYADVGN